MECCGEAAFSKTHLVCWQTRGDVEREHAGRGSCHLRYCTVDRAVSRCVEEKSVGKSVVAFFFYYFPLRICYTFTIMASLSQFISQGNQSFELSKQLGFLILARLRGDDRKICCAGGGNRGVAMWME